MSKAIKARPYTVGPGILRVKSSELIKTPEAKRQMEALRRMKDQGLDKY